MKLKNLFTRIETQGERGLTRRYVSLFEQCKQHKTSLKQEINTINSLIEKCKNIEIIKNNENISSSLKDMKTFIDDNPLDFKINENFKKILSY